MQRLHMISPDKVEIDVNAALYDNGHSMSCEGKQK